jgi:hypothetical protein
MYRHGCSFLEEGAHLAAFQSNLDLSTGFVENALALHFFAISSLTGYPVFAIFVTISSDAESPRTVACSQVIVCHFSRPISSIVMAMFLNLLK